MLQEIVTNHHSLLTNDKIKPIIQFWSFFSNLRILSFVLNPLRKAVLTLALESRLATLANCFLCLIKLAAVLKNLLRSFNLAFCNYCTKIINKRCKEFNYDKYITYFSLDSQFRNALLKKCAFKRILTCAALIGKTRF